MIELQDILYKVSIRSITGNLNVMIDNLQIDSRKVTNASVFIALKGVSTDGHEFINTAIENGAAAIIGEQFPGNKKEGVTYVQVENSAAAAGHMAHNFYRQPSEKVT